jgi:hypothetical protein
LCTADLGKRPGRTAADRLERVRNSCLKACIGLAVPYIWPVTSTTRPAGELLAGASRTLVRMELTHYADAFTISRGGCAGSIPTTGRSVTLATMRPGGRP